METSNIHLTLAWAKSRLSDVEHFVTLGGIPSHYTVMRFSDLKETSTDTTADSIFEKFR